MRGLLIVLIVVILLAALAAGWLAVTLMELRDEIRALWLRDAADESEPFVWTNPPLPPTSDEEPVFSPGDVERLTLWSRRRRR